MSFSESCHRCSKHDLQIPWYWTLYMLGMCRSRCNKPINLDILFKTTSLDICVNWCLIEADGSMLKASCFLDGWVGRRKVMLCFAWTHIARTFFKDVFIFLNIFSIPFGQMQDWERTNLLAWYFDLIPSSTLSVPRSKLSCMFRFTIEASCGVYWEFFLCREGNVGLKECVKESWDVCLFIFLLTIALPEAVQGSCHWFDPLVKNNNYIVLPIVCWLYSKDKNPVNILLWMVSRWGWCFVLCAYSVLLNSCGIVHFLSFVFVVVVAQRSAFFHTSCTLPP